MKKFKYLTYRLKWFLANWIDFDSPIHLDIELNNNCNQKCMSCWHSKKDLPFKISEMELPEALKYLRQGAQMGVKSVKFNLRGEPLLSPILVKCVNYAKELKYIDIMINTNGILLTAEKIKELDRAGLTTCIISIDSWDQKTYCKLHGCTKSHYNKLIHNLINIYALVKDEEIKTKVKLNFHFNELNINEDFDWAANLYKYLKPVRRYTMKRHGSNITIDRPLRKRKKKCPHMQKRLTVTSNYNIYPCCVCYDEPEDIRINYCIPNPYVDPMYSDSLSEAWDSISRYSLKTWYRGKVYSKSCTYCTSGDIWKK